MTVIEQILEGINKGRAMYDSVHGSITTAEESFGSLSPEQIEKYKEKFYQPEHFYMVGGEILAEKYTPSMERADR